MPVAPKNLRVLVVDSKSASRINVVQLLRDCQYQVYCVRTSKEALQLLAPATSGGAVPFDIILKEHNPPEANACRLLRRMARTELLAKLPVVLVSDNEDREVVMKCLTLGAIDYLVKPLRHNELRHIWTRVWWWRKSGLGGSDHVPLVNTDSIEFQASSDDSKETKCDDDEEPTSKEGSAPDNLGGSNGNGSNGNGSNGNGSNGNGSNGNGNSGNNHGSNNGNGNGTSGNGASRVEANKQHLGEGNHNGSSGGNGNSATKHRGSNGNNGSDTLAERNALVNTAEGKAPPNVEPPKPNNRPFRPYNPDGAGRKRPATTSTLQLHLAEHHHQHHQHGSGGLGEDASKQQRHAALDGQRGEQAQGVGTRTGAARSGGHDSRGHDNVSRGSSQGTPAGRASHLKREQAGASGLIAATSTDAPQALAQMAPAAGVTSQGVAAAAAAGVAKGMSSGGSKPMRASGGGPSEDTAMHLHNVHGGAMGGHGGYGGHGQGGGHAQHAAGGGDASATMQRGSNSVPGSSMGGARGSQTIGGSNAVGGAGAGAAGSGGGGSHTDFSAVAMASLGAGNSFGATGSVSLAALHHQAAAVAQAQAQAQQASPAQVQGGVAMAGPWSQEAQAQAAMQAAAAAAAQAAALQAALQGGAGQVLQPMFPGVYPGAPQYGPMVGLAPHMLQQLNPQVLQAMFSGSSLTPTHSQASTMPGVDPMSMTSQLQSLYPMQHMHYMPQAPPNTWPGAPMAGAHMAGMHLRPTGVMHHPLVMHPGAPVDPMAAAAAIAAAGGTRTPPVGAARTPPMTRLGSVVASVGGPPHQHQHRDASAVSRDRTQGGGVEAAVTGPAVPTRPQQAATAATQSTPNLSRSARQHRAAALAKYREKRNNLKFGKVIRYESRKQLAQQRPRVKGMFVKQILEGGPDVGGAAGRGGGGRSSVGGGSGREEAGQDDEGEGEQVACGEEDGDDAEMQAKSGFGDQNFDEGGGEYEHDRTTAEEGEAMEEEEGGGGSGTDAGDGKARNVALLGQCKPESDEGGDDLAAAEEPEREEEGGDEEDDVVNSLRKLREGLPRAASATGAGPGGGGGGGSKAQATAKLDGAGCSTPPKAGAGGGAAGGMGASPGERHTPPAGMQGGGALGLAHVPGAGGRAGQSRGVQHGHKQAAAGHAGGDGGLTLAGGAGQGADDLHGQHGSSGPNNTEGTGTPKNGSDSGSNSPDENGPHTAGGHNKGNAANMSSHGSGGSGAGPSGHESRGGSHEGSGHGSVVEDKGGAAAGGHGRHNSR